MFLTQTAPRQREILEIVLRNGWDYMKQVLSGDKASKPSLPPPAVLRNILIDLGPVYVKLGQLLSTRPDLLPKDYIEALSTLQAKVPPVPWTSIETVIRRNIGKPLETVFTKLNPEAVAAGSIAQTHRATLKNGQEVAIKIQRPGIDQIVARDIALIKGIADLISYTEIGSDYDLVSLAEEFSIALNDELDFRKEANHTMQLKRNLSKSQWFNPQELLVPEINQALTTDKILVMEWLDGVPILLSDLSAHQNREPSTQKRRQVTRLLFRSFFQQLYIDGLFHADPHPGNIFYLTDGRVALLDCGLVGRLDPKTQQTLTELLLAIVDLDGDRCSQLVIQLSDSSRADDLGKLKNDLQKLLRKYYNLTLSELNFSQVFYEMLQVCRNNKIKLPGNMGLYAKTLANLEGVARSFDPEVNLLDELKPLMTDLFRRQLLGADPAQLLLRTALDLKSLSLGSPRQIELMLDRITSETLKWNLTLRELEPMRRSLDDSANRLSFSIVVGSLIIGAAIISSNPNTNQQLSWLSTALFAVASLLGLWLVVSILRSGRLR